MNLTMRWAAALVDELERCGVEAAAFAPGSRSAPLAIAFHRSRIRSHAFVDERSAAYFALGAAKESGRPAVALTTSGTAAANLLPAVVEADLSHAGFIALTADRPRELVDVGANQAIRQTGLFGHHVRWEADLGAPEPKEELLRHLRQAACRAVALARTGPVHLNVPLREPLEPSPEAAPAPSGLGWDGRPGGAPFLDISTTPRTPARLRLAGSRGLVFLGPGATREDAEVARATGMPVLADPLSGSRGRGDIGPYDAALASARLRGALRPDWVVHFGGTPTSRHLRLWLHEHRDQPRHIVQGHKRAWDDLHAAASATTTPVAIQSDAPDSAWIEAWQKVGRLKVEVPSSWEAEVPAALAALQADLLWVGSSLPVRDLDRFATNLPQRVLSNRGASGIDGVLSSAIGAAASLHARNPEAQAVAYLGDTSFVHDLGALAALRRHAPRLKVVVLDNGGGRIFEQLPVATTLERAAFEELLLVPPGVDLGKACQAFAVPHTGLDGPAGLAEALAGSGGVIQVKVDGERAARLRREHLAAMAKAGDELATRMQDSRQMGAGRNGQAKAEVPR